MSSVYIRRFAMGCVAAATLTVVLAAASSIGGPIPGPLPLFPSDNWWNLDVSGLPLDPASDSFINFVGRTRRMHPDFGGDVSPGSTQVYGFPYAVVDSTVAKQSVQFDFSDESDGVNHTTNQSVPFYPIPPEAVTQPHWIEGGEPGNLDLRSVADRHLLIVDRDSRKLYELYNVFFDGAQWHAGSGALFDLNSNARRPDGWTSADAAGLAILPGLVRYDEVFGTAEINHAFRVTVRATNGYVYPASHRAGSTTGALPMGARLRLKATKDLSGFRPEIQKIFRAMQKYGLLVADNGSDLYVSGAYDTRWNNDVLNPAFSALTGNDFEVVKLGIQAASSVTADSVSPGSGSGSSQSFTLKYSDSAGVTDLSTAWVWFNATLASSAANSCLLYYNRASSQMFLLNDAGTTWMAATVGGAGTLSNRQCAVTLGSSTTTAVSGNTLTVNAAMTFKASFSGAKNIYMYAAGNNGSNSGWQTRGTWTVAGTSLTTPTITWANPAPITAGTPLSATQLNATASVPGTFTYTPAAGTVLGTGANQMLSVNFAPTDTGQYTNASASVSITVLAPAAIAVTADSVTPNSGTGASQTFALQYSDNAGATDLSTVWVWFNATLASSAANSCLLYYDRASNQISLLNDAGNAWAPRVPGATGSLSNSQCSINLASTGVTTSGTALTLNVAMVFTPTFAGAKSIFMYGAGAGANSGWQTRGTWTVSGGGATVVSADSVSPSSGAGSSQMFALQYSDSAGAVDVSTAWAWFNATFASSAANSCLLYYQRSSNQLFLLNDAGTVWMAAIVGSAGSLANGRCSVALGSSSTVVLSGTTLTVNVAMTFAPAFSGMKDIYLYVSGGSGLTSGWQTRGAWTVP